MSPNAGGAAAPPSPGDFLGRRLIRECTVDTELVLPATTSFGLPRSASYLYGTWRDRECSPLLALRAVGPTDPPLRYLFESSPDSQLERHGGVDAGMLHGAVGTDADGEEVTVSGEGPLDGFAHHHAPTSGRWREGAFLEVAGWLVAPARQWFTPRPGVGCSSASAKCRFGATTWTWRIDPKGEQARTVPGTPVGADGTCRRDDDNREVVLSMANSDWWHDGRARPVPAGRSGGGRP